MRALLVIDVQNGIVNFGNFTEELTNIQKAIREFKTKELPIFFMKHLNSEEDSALLEGSEGAELHDSVKEYADTVIEKRTPSSFYKTDLAERLKESDVDHLIITGFNTEYCCMFTSIAAFDRGYRVTYIENATGTMNSGETYGQKGIDIKDFVETVLHWSDAIEVISYEEYVEKYN
ncbi:isochorismatase family protein [Sporosarcina sp. BI001-red]|uniref:isochorismatase family protein n=1 Tax=Sporosarcina sp. BI001-red TaxID=2282866 RepID=UPI000E23AE67|nr:isochorismatase family protein [Sporosarcina sp. BI001-red]REB07426.1 isochorismatase family protein [Sporosarcina sp. BI001-red]